MNKNYEIALEAITQARKDHCDGSHSFYRLSAYKDLDDEFYNDATGDPMEKLKADLSNLTIRPERIYIYHNKVEIDWYAGEYDVVTSLKEYVRLLLEFADFLNSAPIKGLYINSGAYGDDPGFPIEESDKSKLNNLPEFNEKCFGYLSKHPMDVYLM